MKECRCGVFSAITRPRPSAIISAAPITSCRRPVRRVCLGSGRSRFRQADFRAPMHAGCALGELGPACSDPGRIGGFERPWTIRLDPPQPLTGPGPITRPGTGFRRSRSIPIRSPRSIPRPSTSGAWPSTNWSRTTVSVPERSGRRRPVRLASVDHGQLSHARHPHRRRVRAGRGALPVAVSPSRG